MSLLDDVSIVVTPNGYKAGELYAVVPVPSEGAEEVTNGDFATDSDWNTSATGISIAGGKLSRDATATASIFQSSSVITPSVLYEITFEIVDYTSGTLTPRFGWNGTGGTAVSGVGTYTQTIIKVNQNVIELYGTAFVGSIDNVSVKEYTSADMDVTRATAGTRVDENGLVNYAEVIGSEEVTNGDFTQTPLGTGWTVTDTDADNYVVFDGSTARLKFLNTSPVTQLSSSFSFTSGKTYKLVVDIASVTSGGVKVDASGISELFNTVGINTRIVQPTGSFNLTFYRATSNVDLTFNSVSVKEVTRDNVPRIDYTGGGCPHILAEPQRTNLVTYSEDFSNWSALGTITVTTNDTTSPSGGLTADKVLGLDSFSAINQIVNGTSGIEYTNSCYIKNLDATSSSLLIRNGITAVSSLLNWSGSVLSSITNNTGTTTFTDEGNGWYRLISTYTSLEATQRPRIYPAIGTANTSVYIWGAQLEVGSYATSYIPTSGSTVTRNQDIFTRDGIGSLINSTEGTIFVEMAALANDSTNRYISINDGSSTNRIIFKFGTSSNNISALGLGTATSFSLSYSSATITNMNKIALKYKVNDCALWVNGVEVATDTTFTAYTANTLNQINFSNYAGSGQFLDAKVKQLQVYNTALTDEQLLQLTGESGTDFYESYAEMAAALTYTIQ